MNRQQFLSRLAEKLVHLDAQERERILSYYAQMIDERIEDGMTEEAAVSSMESVESITAEILEDHPEQAIPVQTVPVNAQPQQKKKNKGFAIAMCIIIAVVATLLFPLVTGVTHLITNSALKVTGAVVPNLSSHAQTKNGDQTMFDPAQVDFIDIDWEAGDVIVTVSDVQQITLHEEGTLDVNKYPMVLSTGSGGLNVTYARDDVLRGIADLLHVTDTKDLYVEIPTSWANDLIVRVNMGAVTVTDGSFANIRINADMGDIDIKNVTAQCIVIDADMGDVDADVRFDTLDAHLSMGDLELCAQTGSGRIERADCDMGSINIEGDFTCLDVDNDMGDIEIVATSAVQVIKADCDMGSIELTLPETLGFTMETDEKSSGVHIDFPVTRTYRGDDEVFVFGDGACRIELACDMGNIDVRQR